MEATTKTSRKPKTTPIAACAFLLLTPILAFSQVVDTYSFKMSLKVPRIYDNHQSLGYRKYQTQTIKGDLQLIYRSDGEFKVRVRNLYNKTHKVNGLPITYICYDNPLLGTSPLAVAVGSNKTCKFKHGALDFGFVADPSYNIGTVSEDNSLYVGLSGFGTISNGRLKKIRGTVTGRIGCGCLAYGHVSPTRIWFGFLTDVVFDIAPVTGTFRAQFKGRHTEPDEKQDG